MSSQNQNPNLTNAILPGMVEASTEMHHAKLNLTADISEILTINAYEIFDCPIIESTELYAMKSGGELTSRRTRVLDIEHPQSSAWISVVA